MALRAVYPLKVCKLCLKHRYTISLSGGCTFMINTDVNLILPLFCITITCKVTGAKPGFHHPYK